MTDPKKELTPAEKLLAKVDARIALVSKAIVEQMYAEDLEDAMRLVEKFRHEIYVKEVNDERAELEYLRRRKSMLEEEVKAK